MKVKVADRVGGVAGHWWITSAKAKKLCDGAPPKMGYEKVVMESPRDQAWPFGTVKVYDKVYVANVSGRFQIRDDNRSMVREIT
jgi:hypothetical protein